mmetsp:Transcript_14963/g.28156  ORF Transcript_14963/g.28156 Transcript_14963/m.28156 type:complete len:227 (+) Transcript_14963:239-919(+)
MMAVPIFMIVMICDYIFILVCVYSFFFVFFSYSFMYTSLPCTIHHGCNYIRRCWHFFFTKWLIDFIFPNQMRDRPCIKSTTICNPATFTFLTSFSFLNYFHGHREMEFIPMTIFEKYTYSGSIGRHLCVMIIITKQKDTFHYSVLCCCRCVWNQASGYFISVNCKGLITSQSNLFFFLHCLQIVNSTSYFGKNCHSRPSQSLLLLLLLLQLLLCIRHFQIFTDNNF